MTPASHAMRRASVGLTGEPSSRVAAPVLNGQISHRASDHPQLADQRQPHRILRPQPEPIIHTGQKRVIS
jgi:hypothetical protein